MNDVPKSNMISLVVWLYRWAVQQYIAAEQLKGERFFFYFDRKERICKPIKVIILESLLFRSKICMICEKK